MGRIPLWEALVQQGYFYDKEEATGWIMAGQVLVNEARIDKPGALVSSDGIIRVKGWDRKYVGRGDLKLEGALTTLNVDVMGAVALDTGASIGGFTDCLLQHGASKVYAIDVGYGELAGKLRADPRVVNMERTNISDVDPATLTPPPWFATVGLSYLSLKDAIPIIRELLAPGGEMLCLVKPLFEISDPVICRTGKITSPEVYERVLEGVIDFTESIGLNPIGLVNSPIQGSRGTREFFIHIALSKSVAHPIHGPSAFLRSLRCGSI
ncbi:MAG: TlyA family RNA methyltransferase [Firmicutes bacterium]|nr:TlyA family RNA methyltransferase [Bacillota bacterium]